METSTGWLDQAAMVLLLTAVQSAVKASPTNVTEPSGRPDRLWVKVALPEVSISRSTARPGPAAVTRMQRTSEGTTAIFRTTCSTSSSGQRVERVETTRRRAGHERENGNRLQLNMPATIGKVRCRGNMGASFLAAGNGPLGRATSRRRPCVRMRGWRRERPQEPDESISGAGGAGSSGRRCG